MSRDAARVFPACARSSPRGRQLCSTGRSHWLPLTVSSHTLGSVSDTASCTVLLSHGSHATQACNMSALQVCLPTVTLEPQSTGGSEQGRHLSLIRIKKIERERFATSWGDYFYMIAENWPQRDSSLLNWPTVNGEVETSNDWIVIIQLVFTFPGRNSRITKPRFKKNV